MAVLDGEEFYGREVEALSREGAIRTGILNAWSSGSGMGLMLGIGSRLWFTETMWPHNRGS